MQLSEFVYIEREKAPLSEQSKAKPSRKKCRNWNLKRKFMNIELDMCCVAYKLHTLLSVKCAMRMHQYVSQIAHRQIHKSQLCKIVPKKTFEIEYTLRTYEQVECDSKYEIKRWNWRSVNKKIIAFQRYSDKTNSVWTSVVASTKRRITRELCAHMAPCCP